MVLKTLNPGQSKAVTYTTGPLLILAGPGSGKTLTITEKVIHLIDSGISPERILALTFSEKAAGEMQERIEKNIGIGSGITVSTFHSFCNELIREFPLDMGISYGTRLVSKEHSHVWGIKNIDAFTFENIVIPPSPYDLITSLLEGVSQLRDHLITPDELKTFLDSRLSDPALDKEDRDRFLKMADLERFYRLYQDYKWNNDLIDFDDMIALACSLLDGNDVVRENIRSRYDHILVDEFQDTNSDYKMKPLLTDSLNKASTTKERYTQTKDEAIEKIRRLDVFPDFIDAIRSDLKTANNFEEAEFIGQTITEYLQSIEERIQLVQTEVDSLKGTEEKIVSQALIFAMRYKDYLKRFPALSKINLDGRQTEMIRINFKQCEFPDDIAQSEMKRYIQQLIEEMDSQQMNDKDLRERFTPAFLIGKVLDLDKISVSICKIDTNDTRYQEWEKIQASTGQENAMFIIFLVVLMSYIRNIVVDRMDVNTSKVIIIDNPFGTTTACYLWEKIVDILEKNKVQLICPGHKIDSMIREYFPVSHILDDHDMSENGCVRISIKTTAKDEDIRSKIEQESRYGQLTLV